MSLEKDIFDFLARTYAQRQDARQKDLGLQYTLAETHDLAREIAGFMSQRNPTNSPACDEIIIAMAKFSCKGLCDRPEYCTTSGKCQYSEA